MYRPRYYFKFSW